MGFDVFESQETLLHPSRIKVHLDMCTKLLRLLKKISSILHDIEVAPPQCSSGIQVLCQLRNAMDIAMILVQSCCESSKLYLALTGRKVVSRFEKTKNLLQQSLCQLQNMVPVVSQLKISEILGDLRTSVFFMNSHEEEASKALRMLLRQDITNPLQMSDIEVLQFAALKLHLSSQKDFLIERKSIGKLLSTTQKGNSTKREALTYLLHLMENNRKLIAKGQTQHPLTKNNESFTTNSAIVEPCPVYAQNNDRATTISHPIPYEEFKSTKHMIVSDKKIQASALTSLQMNLNMSNISLGSLDYSDSLELPTANFEKGYSSVSKPSDVDSQRFQVFCSTEDIRRQYLSNVNGLPWKSRCRAVQDVREYFIHANPSCDYVSSENFWNPLVHFLEDAVDKNDAEAQKAGTQLLLTFMRLSRWEAAAVHEDVYTILTSFIGTEAAAEAFSLLEILSTQENVLPKFEASGALTSIIKFLEYSRHNREFQAIAIEILYNLSSNIGNSSYQLMTINWIPILVHSLEDSSIRTTCLSILENLCQFKEARVSIAETDGCIGSIVELLEVGSYKEQEHGVGILFSLCEEHQHYCNLAGHEGIVPSLIRVSVNGSGKGKILGLKLLQLFRDARLEDDQEQRSRSNSDINASGG